MRNCVPNVSSIFEWVKSFFESCSEIPRDTLEQTSLFRELVGYDFDRSKHITNLRHRVQERNSAATEQAGREARS